MLENLKWRRAFGNKCQIQVRKILSITTKSFSPSGRTPILGYLGSYFAAAGEEDKALETLQSLTDISKQEYIPPTIFAVIYARLGQIEEAVTWLERAYEERDHGLIYLKVFQAYDSMRSHPRFQDLMRRLNFPD